MNNSTLHAVPPDAAGALYFLPVKYLFKPIEAGYSIKNNLILWKFNLSARFQKRM